MTTNPSTAMRKRAVAVIMGGGAGTRLFPLTKDRAKPAVPLGGKYRLVDIPISNCLNSDLRKIYVLTQFNSMSLHRHIQRTYKFDEFSNGFVEIMAARQSIDYSGWYQGTADAVRQNLSHFDNEPHDLVVILSGDQLYRMNFRHLITQHLLFGSQITVATIPVNRDLISGFGIMQISSEMRIQRFVEKPKDRAVQDQLMLDNQTLRNIGQKTGKEMFLASMGIYIFNREVLHQVLNQNPAMMDFGKDIIPLSIKNFRVHAYIFQGYWEDIGTIKAFYNANLDLCEPNPKFNFFDAREPIHTRPRNLPPTTIEGATMKKVVFCAGCYIRQSKMSRVLLGNRSIIGRKAIIEDTVLMGADYFEEERVSQDYSVPIGVGEGTVIRKAIIDKNARIGKHCVISPEGKPDFMDHELFYIRDGIIVIPKGTEIPDGVIL